MHEKATHVKILTLAYVVPIGITLQITHVYGKAITNKSVTRDHTDSCVYSVCFHKKFPLDPWKYSKVDRYVVRNHAKAYCIIGSEILIK